MGCGASSQSKACAKEQFEAAVAKFPADPVEGSEEKLGMGKVEKQFENNLKSFTWTLGGTGEVKIGKVQNVTLNKTPKIQLEIEECTGVFKCDNLANGNVSIKKANILYMHDTCESKVKVDECNCLIILKDGNSTEYTVGSGEVISVDHGNIVLNKGAGVRLKSYDSVTEGLLEGEAAEKEFTGSRHQGGATVNNI